MTPTMIHLLEIAGHLKKLGIEIVPYRYFTGDPEYGAEYGYRIKCALSDRPMGVFHQFHEAVAAAAFCLA